MKVYGALLERKQRHNKKRGKGITILREFIVGKAETAKMLNAHSDK